MSNNFNDLKGERQSKAQQEINDELGKQMDDYMVTKWNKIEYEKKPMAELPIWFMKDFKSVILNTKPNDIQILSHQLFLIGQTEVKDLAFGQIGIMFSVFNFALPTAFVKNFDEYIEKRKELDKIMMMHNDLYQKKNDELLNSKKFMLSLYDQTNWTKKSKLITV